MDAYSYSIRGQKQADPKSSLSLARKFSGKFLLQGRPCHKVVRQRVIEEGIPSLALASCMWIYECAHLHIHMMRAQVRVHTHT